VELLIAVRAEKNTVLATSPEQAEEFAHLAREHLRRLKELRQNVAEQVSGDPGTREGQALASFDRGLEDFEKNMREVLRLAVTKSVTAGRTILHKELYPRTADAADFVATLADPASGDSADGAESGARRSAKAAAGRELIGRLYELLFRLSLHLDSIDDSEMIALEADIRTLLAASQDALRRLSGMLSDEERSRGSGPLAALEAIKTHSARIQELSRANTDHKARELTMIKTVEYVDRCDGALAELLSSLTDVLGDERAAASRHYAHARTVVMSTGAIGLLIALFLAAVVIQSVTRPVTQGMNVFEAIAAGDLTGRMNLQRRDELGRLGASTDQMAAALCETVKHIRTLARQLGGSASELGGVSHELLSQSQEMAVQAESVAAGTEQMTSNITSMAAAAEQMSSNVVSISAASEEVSVNVATISASADGTSRSVGSVSESIGQITVALQDVARDARQGSDLSGKARDMASAANQTMHQLGQAASEITKVTDVIKSIALQTNLLALNATIEAASAGEAGKGFAVVAGEIKELASQSGQSAEDIARKIDSVQAGTRQAMKVIEEVADSICEVNVSASRISQAVDAQTHTANGIAADAGRARQGAADIARSIAEVAQGATDVSRSGAEVSQAATDVSRNAAEAARAAENISANIHGVSEATRENSASAAKVNAAAKRLGEIAAELQRSVARFKTGDEHD
jgi:methyl-accepting chemotaxis protein